MTRTTTNRPTHSVYAVIMEPGADRGQWTEIGAAWPHPDGKGFTLKLDLVPMTTDIRLREPRSEGGAP